mgnify:CR=1 FL=1
METFLNIFAPVAFTIFFVGVGLRLSRWFLAVVTPRRIRGSTQAFIGGPQPMSLPAALKAVLIDPVTHFYMKANKTWGRGYMLYHMAIITEVTGYTLAAFVLFARMIAGQGVPDVARHLEQSQNYAPANLLAIVFGNGEPLQAQFLFGDFATLFISVTWVAVICAVLGNFHLMYTLLRGRHTAIVGDIDEAAKGIRAKGRLSWDRLLVRSLIFCIIWTELLARLHLVPGIVFVHSALGVTLFTLLPFTYLFHIVYNVLAVFYATRRRMVGTVA